MAISRRAVSQLAGFAHYDCNDIVAPADGIAVTVTTARNRWTPKGVDVGRISVTKKKRYPKPCTFLLDERDGRLRYGEHDVGPVPSRFRPGTKAAPAFSWQQRADGRLRVAIGDGWRINAVYRCRNCDHWAVGSGFLWCSEDCRRAVKAREARDRRARQAKARPAVICVVCGDPIEAGRGTRKFCSDRCRQVAHHAAVNRTPA